MTTQPNSRAAYAQSLLVVALCTAVAWLAAGYMRPGNVLMIYLMGSVIVAKEPS